MMQLATSELTHGSIVDGIGMANKRNASVFINSY